MSIPPESNMDARKRDDTATQTGSREASRNLHGSSPAGSLDAEPSEQLRETLDLLISMGRELRQSDPDRASDCLRRATEIAHSLADDRQEARALMLYGSIENSRGSFAKAEPALERAVALARGGEDRPGIALCLNALAYLRMRQGRSEEALEHLREGLGHTTETGSDATAATARAETLALLGLVYAGRGEITQALRYYEEALEMRRASQDQSGIAKALNLIGNLRHRMGDFHEAVSCYREALQNFRALENKSLTAATANNLATTLGCLGELDEAHKLFEECRRLYDALKDPGRVADVLMNLGLLAQGKGRMDEAQNHYLEGLARHRELGNFENESNALTNLSHLALARGRCEEAIAYADQSIALLRQSELLGTLAPALVGKGLALLELGSIGEAQITGQEARQAATKTQAKSQLAEVLVLQANVSLVRRELEDALRQARESQQLAEEMDDPEILANSCRCLGTVHRERGELEQSQQHLARAARLLRGREHSYERARVLFEEGILLSKAGAAEGGSGQLHRAANEFSQLGNVRWQVEALIELAFIVGSSDPPRANASFAKAHSLAQEHGLTELMERARAKRPGVALGQPSESDAASDSPGPRWSAVQASLVRQFLGISSKRTIEATALFDPFFAFLREQLAVARVLLHLESTSALRWAERVGPMSGTQFRALDPSEQNESAGKSIRSFVCPRDASVHGAESPDSTDVDRFTCRMGATEAPFGLLVIERRSGPPFSRHETEAVEAAAQTLALALDAQFDRVDRSPIAEDVPKEEDRLEFLVGSSRPMMDIYRLIEQVAPSDSSVLILGESGTGKELAARSIHVMSPRNEEPFVAISCPSIPPDLIESELFGYERGAFTGAVATRAGKIELADKGTLFLDEVGDMPLPTQAKILRFLQEREFQRVGGRESRRVDVRLISATSRDLSDAMRRGEFREDLYYRLNVVPLSMPSLKDRLEDIPLLVDDFLRSMPPGKSGNPRRISAGALDQLLLHDWPGNVRELRNAVEYMVTLAEGDVLEPQHLPINIRQKDGRTTAGPPLATSTTMEATGLDKEPAIRPGETLESRLIAVEATLIRTTLDASNWNQSEAARRLGITESKIRKRMKQYGIERPGGT